MKNDAWFILIPKFSCQFFTLFEGKESRQFFLRYNSSYEWYTSVHGFPIFKWLWRCYSRPFFYKSSSLIVSNRSCLIFLRPEKAESQISIKGNSSAASITDDLFIHRDYTLYDDVFR
jgi:hypothetical protein